MRTWPRHPVIYGMLGDFRSALPDFSPADNVGSPYCVRRYVVDEHLGGARGTRRSAASATSHKRPCRARGVHLTGVHQWHVYDVLGDKPHLQFVGSNHIADDEVVRTVVFRVSGLTRHRSGFLEDNFVCVQQA